MTNFTYDIGVPAAPNNPSNDQPLMLQNTVSISGIWNVDHIGFGAANGGTHQQVTYIAFAAPGAQLDPTSIAYTAAGLAAPAHPQNYFKNSQGVFPLSSIRAFGSFTANNVAPVLSNQINIASTGYIGVGAHYTITLNTNTVNSSDVIVLLTLSDTTNSLPKYSFTNPTLDINGVAAGVIVNFVIIQI